MKYCFNDDFSAIITSDKLFLNNGISKIAIPITNSEKNFIKLNSPFFESTDFKKNHIQLFRKINKYLLKITDNSWFLKYKNTRFEKTALYYFTKGYNNDAIEILQNKQVVIIGCGGVGTEVMKHLLSSGVGKFIIIDFDKVCASNLNRQYLFDRNDIGKFKIDIIKYKYSKIAKIKSIKKKINNSMDISKILLNHKNIDMIINCADTPPLKINQYILSAISNNNIPFISCGVGLNIGSFGKILKTKREKLRALKELESIINSIEWTNTCASSFGPTNSMISDMIAKDIIFYLLGINKHTLSFNKRIIFNFEKLNTMDI